MELKVSTDFFKTLDRYCSECWGKFVGFSEICPHCDRSNEMYGAPYRGKVALEKNCLVCQKRFIPERGIQEKCEKHDDGFDPDDVETLMEQNQQSVETQIANRAIGFI